MGTGGIGTGGMGVGGMGAGGAGTGGMGTGGLGTGGGGGIISNIQVTNITQHTALMTWATDVPATSVVNYDLDTSAKSVGEAGLTTDHAVVLDRMMSGDPHDYQITVTDADANQMVDIVRTFNTVPYAGGALPAGWSSMDIGDVNPGLPGSAVYDPSVAGGTFAVRGTGTDLGFLADSFRFVYRPVNGDFTFTLRVDGYYGYLHMWTKAFTIFRVDLSFDSAFFNQSLNYAGLDYLYYRPAPGVTHVDVTASQLHTSDGAPLWARLQRVGNTFTEYYSQDGVSWTAHGVNGSPDGNAVDLPAAGYIGFGVVSKDNNYLSEIIYSQVSVTNP
jgi:regulation of enolase protein 1 (concanavalin A-like superfamily)